MSSTRIWKIAKYALAGVVGFLLVSIGGGLAWRTYSLHRIARESTIDSTKGIDEAVFAGIGGIEQWIGMRGQDRANPVLLILHGGPGMPASPLPRNLLYEWASYFTVVQWDQRGAGKTFGRSGPVDSAVTIDRMAEDGLEVAEFVRRKLGKQKIVLIGLSWGSMLGVKMAKARPDLFYAYVGTGQAVNQGKYRRLGYEQLLAEAHVRQDRQAIRELEANGPPPYNSTSKASIHTKWANAYEPGGNSILGGIALILFQSPVSIRDLRDYIGGLTTSQDHFRDAVEALDVPSLGTDFAIPFFVFQGALDNVAPAKPVNAYVDSIRAPRKELVLVPNAGHDVMYTRSDEFLRLLIERVRPLTNRSADLDAGAR